MIISKIWIATYLVILAFYSYLLDKLYSSRILEFQSFYYDNVSYSIIPMILITITVSLVATKLIHNYFSYRITSIRPDQTMIVGIENEM